MVSLHQRRAMQEVRRCLPYLDEFERSRDQYLQECKFELGNESMLDESLGHLRIVGGRSSLQKLDSQTISTMSTMPNRLPQICHTCQIFHLLYSSFFFTCHILNQEYSPCIPLVSILYFFEPAAFARSAKASRRLNFASSMTPVCSQYLPIWTPCIATHPHQHHSRSFQTIE